MTVPSQLKVAVLQISTVDGHWKPQMCCIRQ